MTRKVFNMNGGRHSQAALSAFINAMYGTSVANGLNVTVSGGTGLKVVVKAGTGNIDTGLGYGHMIQADADETITLAAASPSLPRNSLIVGYIDKSVTPTTAVVDNINGIFKIKEIAGTPAASPQDPPASVIQSGVGATNPYIILGRVRVGANATSLAQPMIIDMRKLVGFPLNAEYLADKSIHSDKLAVGAVTPSAINTTKFPMFAATTSAWDNLQGGGVYIVNYNKTEYDTVGMFNTSSHQAVVPQDGIYTISAKVAITSAGYNAAATSTAMVYKNGAMLEEMSRFAGSSNALTLVRLSHTFDVKLKKGDIIDVRAHCSENRNYGGLATQSRFSMRLIAEME
nr:MAG TPA: Complement C1q-like protein [Caudoviricetes sp.]